MSYIPLHNTYLVGRVFFTKPCNMVSDRFNTDIAGVSNTWSGIGILRCGRMDSSHCMPYVRYQYQYTAIYISHQFNC